MDKYLKGMVEELEVQTLYDEYTGDYIEAIDAEQVDNLLCNVISMQKLKKLIENETINISGFKCIAVEDLEKLLGGANND